VAVYVSSRGTVRLLEDSRELFAVRWTIVRLKRYGDCHNSRISRANVVLNKRRGRSIVAIKAK